MSGGRGSAWLLLIAGLAALALVIPGPWDGPRYRGRAYGYWFPRWEPAEHDWLDHRQTRLREGGPEVLVVLERALEATDHAFDTAYDDRLARLPLMVRAWLPVRVPASATRRHAREVLPAWLGHGPAQVRAFLERFERLPEDVRRDSCRWWDPAVHDWSQVGPHLQRIAAGDADADLALGAAVALLGGGPSGAAELDLGPVLERLSELPARVWADRRWPDHHDLIPRLAPWGTRAAGGEPWLRGWLATGAPPFKASAALALPFLAPDRHPVKATLDAVLPEIGPEGVRQFWALRRMDAPELRPTQRAFAAALGRVFLGPEADGWREVWARRAAEQPRGWMRPSSFADLRLTGLMLYRSLGAEALPVVDLLPPLLTSPDPRVALESARCLAQVGPVRPGIIADLVPALSDELTGPPLVLLLAAYGPAALPAAPALRVLARDDAVLARRNEAVALGRGWMHREGVAVDRMGRLRREAVLCASNVVVNRKLAVGLGLAGAWPEDDAGSGAGEAEGRTLAALAREALRRIGGED